MDRRVEVVEAMWDAYRREGLEGILAFAAADAVWEPYSADRKRFDSTEDYRRHIRAAKRRGDAVEAQLVAIEPEGEDAVLGSGRLRLRRAGGLEDAPMYWIHRFRGDEVVYTYSSPDLEEVRAAARASGG